MAAARHSFSAQVSDTVTEVDGNQAVTLQVLIVLNTTASVAYLQMFNRAAGKVALGADTPNAVIPMPANSGAVVPIPKDGWYFGGTALSVAGTTGRGNAVAAAVDVFILF